MDPDPAPSGSRKVKFTPKAPPRRTPPVTPKIEPVAGDSDGSAGFSAGGARSHNFTRQLKEQFTGRTPKVEKAPVVQVAFSNEAASSTATRTSSKKNGKNSYQNKGLATDDAKAFDTLISSYGTKILEESRDLTDEDTTDYSDNDGTVVTRKREYREPWDYDSNYPITTPLRRPCSGNPEILNEEEFENPVEYDENTLNSASALGLLDINGAPKMFFVQIPPQLPVRTASQEGKDVASGSSSRRSSRKECGLPLTDLPQGSLGKMLVYKSGAVKLKLGDILYDVMPGTERTFSQSVVAINTKSKECVELGKVDKNAVVSPDVDSMMDNMIDLD